MKCFKPVSLFTLISLASGLIVPIIVGNFSPAIAQATPPPPEASAEMEAPLENAEPDGENGDSANEQPVGDESVEAPTGEEGESPEDETSEEEAAGEEKVLPRMTEAERIRRKILIQGDSAYEAGNFAEAEALYRQAKDETWLLPRQFAKLPPEPFTDEALLSPGAAVYWREAKARLAGDRPSPATVVLGLLTESTPNFVPGQIAYANALYAADMPDEANAVLERALTTYPDQAELLGAQVDLRMAQEQWLEAAIASRQFVALNPEHPETQAQAALADENLNRFQRETRSDIRTNAITNVFTGVLGYALTGGIYGPITAASSAITLLQGENAVGEQYANSIRQRLPMSQSPKVTSYIRDLGNELAAATGRDDLDYEFYVILDPDLNAFALPGGKIFVNAGAILKTDSTAELAGLLSHELSHSVLSHGFQIATSSNLSSSVAQFLPYGGLINNVFLSGYSRQMERQADIVGTQILAASPYAADGVYNVMVTLNEEAEDGPRAPAWLASHPNTEDRIVYLKNLVERGGYDRYEYEGVIPHEEIQVIVARELEAYEQSQREPEEENGEGRSRERTPVEAEQTDLYEAVEKFDW